MTHRTDDRTETFRAGFSGQALTPGHSDYDRSRARLATPGGFISHTGIAGRPTAR